MRVSSTIHEDEVFSDNRLLIMTTSQITDEIFRNLNILAEDEVILARATKHLRKLAKNPIFTHLNKFLSLND